MSVDLTETPVSRESQRDTRHVRLQETPEYIPMLNQGMLHQMGYNTPTNMVKKQKKSKTDSETNADKTTRSNSARTDADSENTASDMNNEFKGIGLHTAAKVIVQSRKAAKRAKSKCRQNAAKMLLKQTSMDSEMFRNYSLSNVHNKIKRQKQIRIAFLQKKFLDELPVLAENSVKSHLTKRIEVLEKLKTQSLTPDRKNTQLELMEEYERPNSRVLTRRQSQLRKSIDMSNYLLNLTGDSGDPNLAPKKEDLEKLLAIARSREKIEDELDLPLDRIQRLSTLRQNVDRINDKFRSLQRTKKGNLKKEAGDDKDKEKYYAPSRFTKIGMAKQFFQRYVRLVMIVQQWIKMIMNKRYDFEKELKSFVDMASDIEHQTVTSSMMEFGLSFDRKYYKANKEISLSTEARKILTTRSQSRTQEMIKQVMNGLQSLRSLSEYPVQTQEKLCQCAWYQTIGPKKLIIRQGHHAQQFYFILSGTAFVKKMTQDPVTGETKATVAARLTRGHSFGEIGLLFNTLRTATVESATPMELLVIGKEDFERIFMKAEDPDDEPDHLKFLRQIPFMRYWPIRILPEEPGACLVHYFKRGTLITENDKHSEWIYIIMSGSCEVLKKLRGVRGRPPAEIRPKSHPLTDIILPELGMPNNHPKIDTGKRKSSKVMVHPDLYRTMSEYYDDLRRRYVYDKMKEDEEKNTSIPKLPEQEEKQPPKIFLRAVSACKRVPSRQEIKAAYRPGSLDNVQSDKQLAHNVFVKVELLTAKGTFGLNTLKYCLDADDDVFDVNSEFDPPILSLVSCGAEVIMVSKKTFLKYADQKCRTAVRDQIKVYPSETILQDSMQMEADWSLFKNTLLDSQLREKRMKLRLYSSGHI